MIFEGSCDTEDWNNDAEKKINYTVQYKNYFKL